MKRKIKLNKKFVSLFLSVMMIWSIGFTGIKVSASTTGLTVSVNDSSNQSIPQYTNGGGSRIDTIFNSSSSIRNTPVRLAANANAKISYNFTNATMAKYQFVSASDLTTIPQFPQDSTMTNINLPAPNSTDAYANDIGNQGTISTMQYVYAGNPGTASSSAQLTRNVSFGTPLSSTMLVQNATVGSDIPNYNGPQSNAFFAGTTKSRSGTVSLSDPTIYSDSNPTKNSTDYVYNPFNKTYCKPNANAAWKAMKFWGYFSPPQSGYYNLGAYSDDGAYGYIVVNGQNKEFVNDWSIASAFPRTNNTPILLSAGCYYPIYMEYYEGCPTQGAFTPVFKYDQSNSANTSISKSDAVTFYSDNTIRSDKLMNMQQNWFYSSNTITPGTIPGAYFGDISGIPFPTQDGIYYIATKFVSGEGTTSGLYGPFIIDKTPPTISNLSVVSDYSSDNKKADLGNTLTITFKASETLQANPQILLDGYVANATSYTKTTDNNYTATVKIAADGSINSSGDKITQTGPINVQIANYSDLSGNVGLPVQDSSVTFIGKTGIALTLTQNPTALTNGNVTITANASASGNGNSIKTIKYAAGNQSVNYFTAGGTSIYDSSSSGSESTVQSTFNVNTNGVYTVYSTDSNGNVAVQTIDVENIFVAAPVITAPTTGTVTKNNTPTITGTAEANSTVKVYDGSTLIGTVNADGSGNWTLIPVIALSDGAHEVKATATNAAGNVSSESNKVNITIDTTPPTLALSQSPTTSTNGTVTISATATDNVAVSSITTPDGKTVQFNPAAQSNSTTYTVNSNGTYTFTATDTAGNVTTQSININNIAISSTNDTSFPNISASLESVTPNPAKSSDEINVKYSINTVPFSLSSGMIDEAEVLVDMSQDMKNNQRFSEVQNGFVNQVINDSNLSGIKLGVVGYNDSVYIGTRSNYSDPKSCVMQKTDENLSNIDKTNFLPLYNLNDGNTKDGYRQFYQGGYISSDISSNDQRQFGSALKAADNVLTNYGTNGAKKAIIIISSGNLTYSDDQIESIKSKGYKIIVLDISNSDNTNIKDVYTKLCGNGSGINGNYYKGTFNDGANYNSVDDDMKNVDASLKEVTGVTTLSINDAKLNIDLGENFEAIDGGGLEGSGKVCTATIPQINFTYNSTTGLWEQSGSIEVNFKVKSESGKYGQLGFGLYTNADNTTSTNSSTISYTNFYNMTTSKVIETPTINVTKDVKVPSAPVIISPTDGTVTKNNKPTITGTADANSTVNVYDDGTTLIGTVTADASGNWTLNPSTALADGKHTITATATDGSGNVSPVSNAVNITINTKVPSAPIITEPKDQTLTKNSTPTITGTADANSTVNVYDGMKSIGTATADASGNWTLIPATALSDGAHTIKATATDSLGNVSPTSNAVNITIDTISPTLTLTPSTTDITSGTVTITATASDSGSGVASITKPDSTIVTDDSTTYTVSDNGTYTFTAVDNAGNVTTQSINISNIYEQSSILKHGLYNGNGTEILDNNTVTATFPVTLAMIVDAESSNPSINLNIDNNQMIAEDNIEFKKYEILDDSTGSIGNPETLTFSKNQNINLTGFTMKKGTKYLIVYTITPTQTGSVKLTATADETSSMSVDLNVEDKPDLF